jgi:hypothetical protein
MTRTLVIVVLLALLSPGEVVQAKDKSCPTSRITDEEAIRLAKAELTRRVKAFDASRYSWSVAEENCDLRVDIEKRNELSTGRKSTLTLTRTGKVLRYLGGM